MPCTKKEWKRCCLIARAFETDGGRFDKIAWGDGTPAVLSHVLTYRRVSAGFIVSVDCGSYQGQRAFLYLGNFGKRDEVLGIGVSAIDGSVTHRAFRALGICVWDYPRAREKVRAAFLASAPQGVRCLVWEKASGGVRLALTAGEGDVITSEGVFPFAEHFSQIMPLDNRDAAFDALWSEGNTWWAYYVTARGVLASRQKKIERAPKMPVEPAEGVSPKKGGNPRHERQTAPHGLEKPLSVDVEIQEGDSKGVAAAKLAARGMTPEEAREVLEAMGF